MSACGARGHQITPLPLPHPTFIHPHTCVLRARTNGATVQVTAIEALDAFTALTLLELGSNRIR